MESIGHEKLASAVIIFCLFVVFILVGVGKRLIGKRDKRFKSGWSNNRKPKWLQGIFCFALAFIVAISFTSPLQYQVLGPPIDKALIQISRLISDK